MKVIYQEQSGCAHYAPVLFFEKGISGGKERKRALFYFHRMSKKKTGRKDQPVKKGKAETSPKKILRGPNQFLLLAILIIASIFIYATSLNNGWTNWDDEGYVLNNELVKSISINEIFSMYVMGNYHPVTVLVQAIEYLFFKESASGFHTISLLLHLANALLVFFTILLLAKKPLTAFLCALLFAIHPLHVESVSWISAQKDLLYTGFYFAAIILYLRFILTGRKKISFFLLSLVAFILSNLSKGQAVTLPVILLLIDFYLERKITRARLVEKLPFFLISSVFGIIAILAQKQSESIQELEDHSFIIQILFAAFSFINYIIKLFLPLSLSADYPYPEKAGGAYPFYIYTAPVIIFIIGYLCIRFRKKNLL